MRFFHRWQTILIGLLTAITFSASGQNVRLSDAAEISLLTCSPSDEEAYTLYGHTAIRVRDPHPASDSMRPIDFVFNYGLFDFSKPHFIYRFARGETDYMLGGNDFEQFLAAYRARGSEVCEQTLALDSAERQRLLDALVENALPENRTYRYNFFFDNCATRPAAMIERAVNGSIAYEERREVETFRDLINGCTRRHPWLTFGCDLMVGAPADRPMHLRESFFIPERLRESFDGAWIITPDGSKRRLVSSTRLLSERTAPEIVPDFFTPLVCSLLLFIVVALLTLIEVRREASFRWLDFLLFFVAGLAGCVLAFLAFFSVHPAMWPNVTFLWLHPLHLIGAVCMAVKRCKRLSYVYHLLTFAALLAAGVGYVIVPQHFNAAFFPLMLTLLMRSGRYLTRRKKIRFE